MAFEDLSWPQGSENMGGLIGDLFFIPIEDVEEASLPSLNADGVSIDGNIAPKSGKEFFQIYHTKGTGKIDDTTVGERDSKSYENMLEFFHPGQGKELANFKAEVCNTPGLWIGKDSKGNFRVLGMCAINGAISIERPAYCESIQGSTGAAASDQNGSTFQVKAAAPHPALYYAGTIPVVPVP